MKIALVTTAGITSQFKSWPEYVHAKALVDLGHRVVAYTYFDPKSPLLCNRREMIDGIEVHRVRRRTWVSWDLFQGIMRHNRPDVVHVYHWSNRLAYQATQMFRRRHVPVVVSPVGLFHDPFLVEDRDRPYDGRIMYDEILLAFPQLAGALITKSQRRRSVRNYLTHAPLMLADAVMALSDHEEGVLRRLGVPEGRIRTVPLCVDPSLLKTDPIKAEDNRFSRPVVLFIGQLKYRKGFDILAKAMPKIVQRFPEASIVVVTHSPVHLKTLQEMVESNGTSENLRLLTSVGDAEKAALYATADVLVLPTRYEGFGLPLVEAMAVGCPVITTNLPVVDEIVEDGVNGLLVAPEDPAELAEAVLAVLEDRSKRAALVEAGRRTILEKFSPDLFVQRVLDLYQEVRR